MGEGSGETLEAKQEPFKADRCFQGRKLLGSASGSSFLVVVPQWLALEKRQLLQALARRETSVTTEYWTCCWQMEHGSD